MYYNVERKKIIETLFLHIQRVLVLLSKSIWLPYLSHEFLTRQDRTPFPSPKSVRWVLSPQIPKYLFICNLDSDRALPLHLTSVSPHP